MILKSLWGEELENLPKMEIVLTDKTSKNLAAHFATMFLANSDTFPLLLENRPFKEAFFRLWGLELVNSKQCMASQERILKFLQNDSIVANDMLPFLKKLKKIGVFDKDLNRHIEKIALSVLKSNESILRIESFEEFDFLKTKKELLKIFDYKKDTLFENLPIRKEWEEAHDNLINTRFSVGVTGVMNAGKSTLLNALIGEELLGTSTVPETANLSIISHSNELCATVNFWNTSEWEQIEKSAKSSKPMEDFVNETKILVGEEWDSFITEQGERKKVKTENLSKFTSAKESNGLCNIVKSVEVGANVSFADDGITIVDTPGLDDPIVQREEITKHYLANCDALIHLMNASQSATQKDVDFIIDAIIYQRIAHIILVITRIDTIDLKSLKEVMSYTRCSITNRLKDLDKPHLIDPILEKIKIFPISGYFALLHKTGQEKFAIKSGWSLQSTGFLDFEKYLHQVLFGGDRAFIAIKATLKTLLLIIKKQIMAYEDENEYLSQSTQELYEAKKILLEDQTTSSEKIKTVEKDAQDLILKCKKYLKTMSQIANTRLIRLEAQLKNRICDDIKYSVQKSGKLPKMDRLEVITETTMKDGLVDLVREYRFELYGFIESLLNPFTSSSSEVIGKIDFCFDPKAYQDEAAKGGVLSTSHRLLAKSLGESVKNVKPKRFDQSIEIVNMKASQEFVPLQNRILPLMEETGKRMVESFSLAIKLPLNETKKSMKQKIETLDRAIANSNQDSKSSNLRLMAIDEKITELQSLTAQIELLSKDF